MNTVAESVGSFFAAKGSFNAGFSVVGPFASHDQAKLESEWLGDLHVVEGVTAGYTFVITDGKPGSTVYATYARESSYEKSLRVALEQCAADWGRENIEGLKVLCSIFGDVSFKEFGVNS